MDAKLMYLLGFKPGIGQLRTYPDADAAFRSSKAWRFLRRLSAVANLNEFREQRIIAVRPIAAAQKKAPAGA
jgi:hypothetical protein